MRQCPRPSIKNPLSPHLVHPHLSHRNTKIGIVMYQPVQLFTTAVSSLICGHPERSRRATFLENTVSFSAWFDYAHHDHKRMKVFISAGSEISNGNVLGLQECVKAFTAQLAAHPLYLNPPKGQLLVVGIASLRPMDPASSFSARRIALFRSLVKA